jgi:hypothetical protein
LLKIKKLEIRRDLCKEIADTFDLDTNEFNFKGNKVVLSFKDGEDILGLPSQGEEIRVVPKKHVPGLFNKYTWKDATAIYYTNMKDYFKDNESYDDDIILHVVLLGHSSHIFIVLHWFLLVPNTTVIRKIRLSRPY